MRVGAGGAIRENGELHDRSAVRDFPRTYGTSGADDFFIAPSAEASFGNVYHTLADLSAGGGETAVAAAAPPRSTDGQAPACTWRSIAR